MQTLSKKFIGSGAIFLVTLCLSVIGLSVADSQLENVAYAAPTCSSINEPIPSWLMANINQNKSVYQQVERETGVPWAMMAGIHYREFNANADTNPDNGQGIYQLYSVYHSEDAKTRNEYRQIAKPGPVSRDSFLKQTRYAAKFVQGKARAVSTPAVTARNLRSNESNMELIKNTLFSYNGRAYAYANQAASLGFNKTSHPYEGSPYVMNKFDCYRESMGLITYDGGAVPTGKDYRLGAFTLYARLRGNSFWQNLQAKSMQAASRVKSHTIKTTSDKSGDIAKVGFTLSRKPSHPVTLKYTASSPSNAKALQSSVTISPSNWNKASRNVIDVKGLNNPHLTGTFEYKLVPTTKPSSRDGGYASVSQSQLPSATLLQQDSQKNNAVYRLYSTSKGKHTYTASGIERDALKRQGWRDEGSSFNYCTAGNNVTARLYNTSTDEYRLAELGSKQYKDAINEGFSALKLNFGTSSIAGTPVYWRYDATNKRSLYTTSKTEATTGLWKDMGVAFNACGSSSEAAYRMYRPSNNSHFITTSESERNNLVSNGTYRYEGVSFYACKNGDVPIYRLYRPSNNTHFLTTSASERDSIQRNLGFKYEGKTMTLCSDDERSVYRLYRSSNKAHFLTTSAQERDSLKRAGFRYEGAQMQAE